MNIRCRTEIRSGRVTAWVLLFLLFSTAVSRADQTFTEYKVKALFLYNFAKYVDWPDGTFANAKTPFTIGILGKDRISDDLRGTVEGKTIDGHPLIIKRVASDGDFKDCQIIFVSNSENAATEDIIARIGTMHILTVGEDSAFLEKGGCINLVLKEEKVHLEVNLAAANKAALKISSKLLAVAETVKGKAN